MTFDAVDRAMVVPTPPRPIFVLGLQRSGTTWLANLLCEHPQVVGIQAAEHRGIHESVFFSHFARGYGDLGDDQAFRRFVRHFTSSDYYQLSGLPEAWLAAQRPRSYAEAFRLVMDEVTRTAGATCWVEKSPHHTLLCRQLAEQFPDGRFVCVTRSDLGLARSRIWAYGRTPQPYPARLLTLGRAAAANALYSRVLRRFAARCPRAILVTYEAMAQGLEDEMRRIAAFLDLEFDPLMLRSRFSANSSFGSARARADGLTPIDRTLVRGFAKAGGIVPLPLLAMFERRRSRADRLEWPDWCWTRLPRPGDLPGLPATGRSRGDDRDAPGFQRPF